MPTPPGYADVSIELRHAAMSRSAYTTFGIDPTATDPGAVAALVAAAILTGGSLASVFDSSVTIPSIRVSLGTDGAEDIIHRASVSISGVASQASVPPNVAVLIHKTTTRGGRRGRGRLFLPWAIDENYVDEGGQILSGAKTALQTQMTTFLTSLAAQNVPMVLLHRTKPGLPSPGSPNTVTGLSVDGLVSTQKRRLGR